MIKRQLSIGICMITKNARRTSETFGELPQSYIPLQSSHVNDIPETRPRHHTRYYIKPTPTSHLPLSNFASLYLTPIFRVRPEYARMETFTPTTDVEANIQNRERRYTRTPFQLQVLSISQEVHPRH